MINTAVLAYMPEMRPYLYLKAQDPAANERTLLARIYTLPT